MNTVSSTTASGRDPQDDLVWLLGQPQLSDYLHFVATKVIDGDRIDPALLVDEWRVANDHYHDLEQAEPEAADTIECLAPEAERAAQIAAVTASRWFRGAFASLPTRIVKVELDKLIVSQLHVEHGRRFHDASRQGDIDAPATLFDVCLPLDPTLPPVKTVRLGENRYRFTSPSTDLRAHPLRLSPPGRPAPAQDDGPCHAMLSLGIGFGANFMSGIRSGSRIVLQNGHHRAYALRAMGATHAYCIVEEVTRKDELRLTASPQVGADPEFFFAARRPPLLKDFFDPALAKRLAVYPIDSEIEVEVTVRAGLATRR